LVAVGVVISLCQFFTKSATWQAVVRCGRVNSGMALLRPGDVCYDVVRA